MRQPLLAALLLGAAVTADTAASAEAPPTGRSRSTAPLFAHRTESVLLQDPTPELAPRAPAKPVAIPVLLDDAAEAKYAAAADDDDTDDGDEAAFAGDPVWVSPDSQPVIYEVLKPTWGFSQALWTSNASIDALLTKLPRNFRVSFIADSPTNRAARKATAALRARMQARAEALNATAALGQMVYSSKSLKGLSKAEPWISQLLCEWPTIFDQMHVTATTAAAATATASKAAATTTTTEVLDVPYLNSFYDWLGWAFWPSTALGNASLPVVPVPASSTCAPLTTDLNGSVALVFDTGACDAYGMVKRAAAANASAVLVASADSDLHLLQCVGAQCDDQSFGLPAVSVSHATGQLLLKAAQAKGGSVAVSFSTVEQCGTSFGTDAAGAYVQTWGGSGLGNPTDATYGNPGDIAAKQFPSFAFLAYAAQNLNYLADVAVRNGAAAVVTPVFDRTPMRPAVGNCYNGAPWGCGPSAVVAVPPPKGRPATTTAADEGQGPAVAAPAAPAYSNVVLDYQLQCNTSADVSCPQWDHVIQLKACCSRTRLAEGAATCNAQDGFELGRWITSFGRGNGHWRTDVTQWLPLLRAGRSNGAARDSYCNLTLYTVPWAGNQGQIPWVAVLNLRFENSSLPAAATATTTTTAAAAPAAFADRPAAGGSAPLPTSVLTPWQNVTTNAGDGIYTLFKWIAFNQSYETYFPTFEFRAPRAGFARAELVAVLSGHGNDNHGCGEFCTTTHHFTLSTTTSAAGSDEASGAALAGLSFENVKVNDGPDNAATGCAEAGELALGTTPNEYGTWLYGRDGWCDGRGVYPWRVDVTAQLVKLAMSVAPGATPVFTLDYRGLWNGTIPDPSSLQQGSPVMMLQTYLVFYG